MAKEPLSAGTWALAQPLMARFLSTRAPASRRLQSHPAGAVCVRLSHHANGLWCSLLRSGPRS